MDFLKKYTSLINITSKNCAAERNFSSQKVEVHELMKSKKCGNFMEKCKK